MRSVLLSDWGLRCNLPSTGSTIIAAVVLSIFSCLTVNRFAPLHLNADILMHSIMSLQNVSLFYWEQNRLASILPLAFSIVKNPDINLWCILFVISITHYLGLLIVGIGVSRSFPEPSVTSTVHAFRMFIISTALFLFAFHDRAVFDITVAHWEQVLPLTCTALLLMLRNLFIIPFTYWLIIILLVVNTALGVNFTSLLPIAAGAAVYMWIVRKADPYMVSLIAVSGLSTLMWLLLSQGFGAARYDSFSFDWSLNSYQAAFHSITGSFDALPASLLLAGFCTITLLFDSRPTDVQRAKFTARTAWTSAALLFAIGWMILFASNEWVGMNKFAFRYFIPTVYLVTLICACICATLLNRCGTWIGNIVTLLLLVGCLFRLVTNPTSVRDYALFNDIRHLPLDEICLYSGDYWQVWPAVYYSLLDGRRAVGLAHRGQGNKEEVLDIINDEFEHRGVARILNINASPDEGLNQIAAFGLGHGQVSLRQLEDKLWEITIYPQRHRKAINTNTSPSAENANSNQNNSLETNITYVHYSENLNFDGWSYVEPAHRWSVGPSSSVSFNMSSTSQDASRLVIKGWSLGIQRFGILLNGERIHDTTLTGASESVVIDLPSDVLKVGNNNLQFELPDARVPNNGDPRVLGFALESLVFE